MNRGRLFFLHFLILAHVSMPCTPEIGVHTELAYGFFSSSDSSYPPPFSSFFRVFCRFFPAPVSFDSSSSDSDSSMYPSRVLFAVLYSLFSRSCRACKKQL